MTTVLTNHTSNVTSLDFTPKKAVRKTRSQVISFIKNQRLKTFFIKGYSGKLLIPSDEILRGTNWRRFLKYYSKNSGNIGMEIEFFNSIDELKPLFVVHFHHENGWSITEKGGE